MLRVIVVAFLMMGCVMTNAGSGVSAGANSLDRYAWNSRLFLVFADDGASPMLARQRADIAANEEGYLDRDLIVFVFVGNELVSSFPEQNIDLDVAPLLAAITVPDSPFTAALIGLDTGVKLLSAEPIEACELFREIDGMPMRRSEMEMRGRSINCRSASGT